METDYDEGHGYNGYQSYEIIVEVVMVHYNWYWKLIIITNNLQMQHMYV